MPSTAPESICPAAAADDLAGVGMAAVPPTTSSSAWKKRTLSAVKLAVAVGLLTWLFVSGRLDLARLARVPLSGALAALVALSVGAMALPAWRWWLLLRAQGLNEPFGRVLRLTWVGYFAALVLPGTVSGDVAKGYFLLRLRPEARTKALSTLVIDRLLGVYSLLLLGGLSVGWLAMQGNMPTAVKTMAGGTVLLLLGATAGVVALWIRPCRQFLLGALPKRWRDSWSESFDLYQEKTVWLFGCLLVSVLSNILVVLSFSAAGECLGERASLAAVFLAGPLVVLANCLPISPGGLGVAEAASDSLFGAFAVSCGASMMALVRIAGAVISLPGCFAMHTPPTDSCRTD